jgi:hypothetical protein
VRRKRKRRKRSRSRSGKSRWKTSGSRSGSGKSRWKTSGSRSRSSLVRPIRSRRPRSPDSRSPLIRRVYSKRKVEYKPPLPPPAALPLPARGLPPPAALPLPAKALPPPAALRLPAKALPVPLVADCIDRYRKANIKEESSDDTDSPDSVFWSDYLESMTDAVTDAPSVGKNVVDAVQPATLARTLWTQYILNVVGDMLESTITAAPPELIPDTYGSGNGSTITAVPPDTYGSGLGSTIAAVPPDTYGSGLGSTITAVPPDTYGSGDRSTITAVPPDTYESVDGDMLGSTITGTTAIEEIGGIDDKVVQDPYQMDGVETTAVAEHAEARPEGTSTSYFLYRDLFRDAIAQCRQ